MNFSNNELAFIVILVGMLMACIAMLVSNHYFPIINKQGDGNERIVTISFEDQLSRDRWVMEYINSPMSTIGDDERTAIEDSLFNRPKKITLDLEYHENESEA
jgi:hypothetical protein